MDIFKKYIGKKIKDRRLELGFETQDAFAAKLDLEQTIVSRWERGEHIPQEKHHEKLFEVLQTDKSILDLDKKDFERGNLFDAILSDLPALNNSKLRRVRELVARLAPASSASKIST